MSGSAASHDRGQHATFLDRVVSAGAYVLAWRRRMWHGQTLAVVLPTYNERDSIARVVDEFYALGVVDEIIVVNNNAAAGTSEEVARTSAREVHEPSQGYGAAIRRGMMETDADLVAVCEPDGTFHAADLHKLLAFSADCDVVFGSRTVDTFIWEGANMGLFLRWGNWAVAKLLEVLYNTTYLSDVGCTFRLLNRAAVKTVLPHAQSEGSFFGLEMMIVVIIAKLRFVQVPVNYKERTGISSVTGDMRKAFFLGLQMIRTILRYRIRDGQSLRRKVEASRRIAGRV
jgi:glycosyltransferase involved in cell wall biosynthesis